jgi:hypothetical protein
MSLSRLQVNSEQQKRVPDDSVEFVVAVPPDQMTALFTLFDEICARFDQKRIYFTKDGDALLYDPTKESSRGPDPETG